MQSDNYLRFLVQELKPFIDKTFPTLPDRLNTFVAGSSMGGLISLYALYKPFQLKADGIMRSMGYKSNNWVTREFPGADHSERSWSKRFEIPLMFLLESPK
ncbi:MAG: alpha/beta hydrolase-fold protein [Bacteroidia bacterium]|nr:alpha/beta hydrolase-fold protein [Bacteroidia bacterium]